METAERYFVRQFIQRNRRERVLYELARKDKRRECLWNITAGGNDRLDGRYLHQIQSSATCESVLAMLIKHGCKPSSAAYVISGRPEWDGKSMPLDQALPLLWHESPFVLVMQVCQTAMVSGESGVSAPWRAMLK